MGENRFRSDYYAKWVRVCGRENGRRFDQSLDDIAMRATPRKYDEILSESMRNRVKMCLGRIVATDRQLGVEQSYSPAIAKVWCDTT